MKAYIIYDNEYRTESFLKLYRSIKEYLQEKSFDITETGIGRGDLAHCLGCFGCWIKTPGECVIPDLMKEINQTYMNSDVVVYICPIVFGQFSANIKNALDRWIPNILPFFEIREDGSTVHTCRYQSYPTHIMLAYADQLTDEDTRIFTDININHRKSVEVIIYHNDDQRLKEKLSEVVLERAGAMI